MYSGSARRLLVLLASARRWHTDLDMAVTTPPGRTSRQAKQTSVRVPSLLARLGAHRPYRRAAGYGAATLGTLALTLGLLAIRGATTPLSQGFGFLVVVVAAAAVGGLGPGVLASILGFLAFNFFFLPPYHTFVIARAEDVVVLFVFLGLSILISALLARARERAEAAEVRAQELRILQTLSAELVALVPGSGAYQSILSQLLGLFGFSAGALYVHDPQRGQLQKQVTVGTTPAGLSLDPDRSDNAHPPQRLPVSAGGRPIGLFLLHGQRPTLGPGERRVLQAFCDQFALVLERDRLVREATEAEVYRQSDQVRRSLLAAVSHDLRSPLAAIKASVTDLLGQDVEQDADYAREALESIDVETDRLAALIANLLDMSRIEGGMLKARLQNVDLAEVLPACVDRVCRQWPELTVPISIEPAAAVVRADPVFLERVVANLLDNAAKAAIDSGNEEVEVQARQADGTTTVCVIDHGKGVPPAIREQLFYPFYQVTERHPRLGTGLGLAISKGFLSLMDGQIWIEDTPGGGATFVFSLPVGAAA
jgi:two-component system, OmpR family, sensor histidine kinase KdpD